ncbi:hypothetical protein FNF29_00965 [Cafeteria roenbergensis]|uniref:Uncharacterized protein n=1 Tax=Cafeteria roenbergensis TaxID=33653 RepID=A0A5A8CV21_CAFRO|nr:hypothetical protein FNF29_00965 [Cafeteria roenbergensis]|eukprot:KAA0156855.1 hypothetical protein FNF29_00965 [Cafeteria roenbergensis]
MAIAVHKAVIAINSALENVIPAVSIPGATTGLSGKLTPLALVLVVVGLITVARVASDVFDMILDVLGACFSSPAKTTRFGKWAVVTGASDGIGKGLAIELCKGGHSVAIVARNAAKLEEAKKEILSKAGCPEDATRVRIVVADFGREDVTKLYGELKAELADIQGDIGLLVNNVGVSYPGAMPFEELQRADRMGSADSSRQMLNVNVLSALRMTELVLPGMKERRSGAVLFVSSAHGRMPLGAPLYAEYGGCKAFIENFAKSLAYECEGKGVTVQVQFPYFVATKMAKIRKPTMFSPSPSAFARSMLAAITSGEIKSVPHWSHKIQDWVLLRLPSPLLKMGIMSMHNGLRKAFLKKCKAKAAEGKSE